MSSNKSGRVLVAAALAAALFLAVPTQAIDGRGAQLGFLERLAAWFVETWMTDETTAAGEPGDDTTAPREDDDDPDGCRGDYTGCIDPNG